MKIKWIPGNITICLVIFLFNWLGALAQTEWIQAIDTKRVLTEGSWKEAYFRYGERNHLLTTTDGSSLSLNFEGVDLVIRLAQHATPPYGQPNLGSLALRIDDGPERVINPIVEPREIVLARNLKRGEHIVRIVHRASGSGTSARIEALGYSTEPTGELAFSLMGENNGYFVDARVILTRGNKVIANRLVRNWLNGQCRIAGLPPGKGYRMELQAIGWASYVTEGITIEEGRETILSPIFLSEAQPYVANGYLFPRIGKQSVKRPGESFRARLQANKSTIINARIERSIGTAKISRTLSFEEDSSVAYLYDREIIAKIPEDTPPGLYNLIVQTSSPERDFHSPNSVMVVKEYPSDPVFISWGHLDTQGQYQAEYLRDLASIANLIGADMVLVANACNPAYIAGALAGLKIPYTINFGNHQFAGFEKWFGPQESMIDFGPDICVLNRSLPWHESAALTDALLATRPDASIKVINAYEHNVPIDLINRHHVKLLHDGHGIGDRVMLMGNTPTQRVGKINAQSFRVIRFRDGRVISCTYLGDPVAPIPFPRGSIQPLRVAINPPADGSCYDVTATITNDLDEPFTNCRVSLVMPAGKYKCEGGFIEIVNTSDCGRFTELTLRADAPPKSSINLRVVSASTRYK